MAYVQLPKFGLAIDWETSGYSLPDYAAKHQGLAFGAIIYDCATLESVEELYCEIQFDPKYTWEKAAEGIHGLTIEHLSKGMTQEEAAAALANLVIKYIGTEPVQALGHRVRFDQAFTDQLLASLGIEFKWHPVIIDSCMLGSVLLETSRSEDIFMMLGLPERGKHNALEDIQNTLASIQIMKTYFMQGLASE